MCVRGGYKKMKDGENENMIKRKVITGMSSGRDIKLSF